MISSNPKPRLSLFGLARQQRRPEPPVVTIVPIDRLRRGQSGLRSRRAPEPRAIATGARGTACRWTSDRTLCSRRPTAVRLSKSSASHSTAPADSDPFLSPSPLASLARSPLEAKCRSIRSSLPRTVVLPSAATIARHCPPPRRDHFSPRARLPKGHGVLDCQRAGSAAGGEGATSATGWSG